MTRRSHTVSQYELPFGDSVDPPPLPPPPIVETPPPSPPNAAESAARAEVLGCCPRLVSRLPAAFTLVCERVGGDCVLITTSAPTYAAHAHGRQTAFTGTELSAMALAAEHDRGTPAALEEWCAHKAYYGPDWRLTAAVALGPVAGEYAPLGWTIGQVFARLGLVLHGVHVHELGEVLLMTTPTGGIYAG